MKRSILPALLLLLAACATPAPPPVDTPAPQPVTVEEKVIGTVRVTASALNVRKDAAADGDVLVQAKKGDALELISRDDSWSKVRLSDGRTGYVASKYVKLDGERAAKTKGKGKKSCPADSDFAFATMPTPAFSDRGAHGTVVVDAWVDVSGKVTKTKVLSNSTGDETLAFLTEREIRTAEFIAPVRNCVPRAFIYTYSRTF
jgi:uncharacterized protein YgiM (DUF1202 family)